MSRLGHGVLYWKDKVHGDFDAVTRVLAQDFTSSYAPAGIIVKKDISGLDDSEDHVVVGAMSIAVIPSTAVR